MTTRVPRLRPGDYLVVDDLTGATKWRSECDQDWDGSLRAIVQLDGKHPDYEYRMLPGEKAPDLITGERNEEVYVSGIAANVLATIKQPIKVAS